ncbi:MAG: hypothetical protein ACXADW_13510 [Candidatus Hodarchaeales archaeon]|jgi:hypothetical protein
MSKKARKQKTNEVATSENAATAQSVVKLVKTTENKLNSTLASVSDSVKASEDKTLSKRNLHAYKTKKAFKKSSKAKLSRRALVIAYLHEAKHTKKQIAALLVSQHDIADISNNLKCVSGTMYDLQANTTCNFKTDEKTDIISCISDNCKYKV